MDYERFVQRLSLQFEQERKRLPIPWSISEGLADKVTADGRMNDFFGATTVIRLNETDLERCAELQGRLFEAHPGALVPIEPDTFHLTIHALSNGYNVSKETERIRESIERHEPLVEKTFREVCGLYAGRTIAMRSFGIGTSGKDVVSIKFYPVSANDCTLLNDLFERLERVYPLGKPFVPHVSLGYFRLREYGAGETASLYATLERLNAEGPFDIRLSVDDFVYQHHYSMNDFRDVFGVRDFLAMPIQEGNHE